MTGPGWRGPGKRRTREKDEDVKGGKKVQEGKLGDVKRVRSAETKMCRISIWV